MSLAQPLPLPSTTDWPQFAEAATIPYGFGRELTANGIPANAERTRFVWLAGQNGGVESVTVDGNEVRGFGSSNITDPAGRPVTEVRFNQSISGVPVITGRGLLDQDTGELIENPGRVVAFLYSLIGRTARNLDLFTSEAYRRSLTVRGVLTPGITGRAQISQIMRSCGAIWADSSPQFAIFYPDEIDSEPVGTLEPGFTSEWQLGQIYTQLRVLFAYDAAARIHRGSVLLRSPDAIERWGEITAEVDAGWLATSAHASDLGRRLLSHNARPRWIYAGSVPGRVYPGQVITVDAATVAPKTGAFPVLTSRARLKAEKSTVTLDALTGDPVTVQVVQISDAFEDLAPVPGFTVTDEGAEFVIKDEAGNIVADAKATLDGLTTRYTDAEGRVVFPAHLLSPGQHTLVVEKGSAVLTFGFTV